MAVHPQRTESENNTNKYEYNPFYSWIFQNIIHVTEKEAAADRQPACREPDDKMEG